MVVTPWDKKADVSGTSTLNRQSLKGNKKYKSLETRQGQVLSKPILFYACFHKVITWRYSCHVLQWLSYLLTDPQRIYRNFIGWETKPCHISLLRKVMTNKKYHTFACTTAWALVRGVSYKDISPKPENTSSSPQVMFTKGVKKEGV